MQKNCVRAVRITQEVPQARRCAKPQASVAQPEKMEITYGRAGRGKCRRHVAVRNLRQAQRSLRKEVPS
ncbi:MAG: hypothetical protein K2M11_00235 [Paramuribaculum sp.]|nr:hypothetical protein [Paramuribaculum sp.]